MNKIRKNVCLIVVVILLCSAFLSACGGKSALTGHWVADEITYGYPDDMVLRSDGTGSADGMSINWSVDGHILRISMLFGSEEYSYSVSGSKLTLDGYSYSKG